LYSRPGNCSCQAYSPGCTACAAPRDAVVDLILLLLETSNMRPPVFPGKPFRGFSFRPDAIPRDPHVSAASAGPPPPGQLPPPRPSASTTSHATTSAASVMVEAAVPSCRPRTEWSKPPCLPFAQTLRRSPRLLAPRSPVDRMMSALRPCCFFINSFDARNTRHRAACRRRDPYGRGKSGEPELSPPRSLSTRRCLQRFQPLCSLSRDEVRSCSSSTSRSK